MTRGSSIFARVVRRLIPSQYSGSLDRLTVDEQIIVISNRMRAGS